jgi:hypothetical protein
MHDEFGFHREKLWRWRMLAGEIERFGQQRRSQPKLIARRRNLKKPVENCKTNEPRVFSSSIFPGETCSHLVGTLLHTQFGDHHQVPDQPIVFA